MEKSVKLQVRKDLNNQQQQNVIKLKGNLISRGYTEIIHILDLDDDFNINYFETPAETKIEVLEFINTFIDRENLTEAVSTEKT